jgi:hypothetical protein
MGRAESEAGYESDGGARNLEEGNNTFEDGRQDSLGRAESEGGYESDGGARDMEEGNYDSAKLLEEGRSRASMQSSGPSYWNGHNPNEEVNPDELDATRTMVHRLSELSGLVRDTPPDPKLQQASKNLDRLSNAGRNPSKGQVYDALAPLSDEQEGLGPGASEAPVGYKPDGGNLNPADYRLLTSANRTLGALRTQYSNQNLDEESPYLRNAQNWTQGMLATGQRVGPAQSGDLDENMDQGMSDVQASNAQVAAGNETVPVYDDTDPSPPYEGEPEEGKEGEEGDDEDEDDEAEAGNSGSSLPAYDDVDGTRQISADDGAADYEGDDDEDGPEHYESY